MKTEQQVLALSMDMVRHQTLGYYRMLRDRDITKSFKCEGVKLNSVYWIMGHLAVSQNWLGLKLTGGEIIRFPWARPFGMGGSMPEEGSDERVDISEILSILNQVHERMLTHVTSLNTKQLEMAVDTPLPIGRDRNVRGVIMHCIRHEAQHQGQLAWLCKLHGIETI
jgi:hypothetical protein